MITSINEFKKHLNENSNSDKNIKRSIEQDLKYYGKKWQSKPYKFSELTENNTLDFEDLIDSENDMDERDRIIDSLNFLPLVNLKSDICDDNIGTGDMYLGKLSNDYYLIDPSGYSYPRYVLRLNNVEDFLHQRNNENSSSEKNIKRSDAKKAAKEQGVLFMNNKFYSKSGYEMEPVLYKDKIRFNKVNIQTESISHGRSVVKVTYADGNTITTEINGDAETINNYFKVGKSFNIGSGGNDNMQEIVRTEILIEPTTDNSLSTQLQRLTGDSWNVHDFEMENGSSLVSSGTVRHKKTGHLFTIAEPSTNESVNNCIVY
jgi:hypothetical protein